ncbi:cytochrome P450 [Phlyctema vagabunda]|uniref:Cytochrome P450 n=1 Tax=Phlyctema vagabunda TaxID=108571 RepID=A0ABR4PL10_9HELO
MENSFEPNISSTAFKLTTWKLLAAPSIFLLYNIALIIYRLYLSPIAKFPGSKLTAATGWYETYLDVYMGGQFTFQIEKWHERYGPIIRVNPWEVHISDPEFYEVLYSTKSKHDKLERLKYRFGLPLSTFDAIHHNYHHRRRAAVGPYFSRQKVVDFSPYIQTCADKLCSRLLSEYRGSSRVVNINEAWAAFVSDPITFYTFAFSYDFLNFPDFITPFTTSIRKLAQSLHLAGHFPWILTVLQAIPESLLAVLNPDMIPVFQFHGEIEAQILKIMSGENDSYKNVTHKTVFNELLQSLPAKEVSVELLKHEAASITGAGIDTTKTTLSLATYHILANPPIYKRLREELTAAIPDLSVTSPTLPELEQLPYLSAIIQESLRLAFGISQRLQRINPHSPIQYKGYTIPPNVPFSMTSYIQHRDTQIFPNPTVFKPERWLHNPTTDSGKPLSRYMVAFSRGPRMCLGMNFANAELFIGLATLFRRVDLELFETGHDAVDMAADYFVPIPRVDTKGVRVVVK